MADNRSRSQSEDRPVSPRADIGSRTERSQIVKDSDQASHDELISKGLFFFYRQQEQDAIPYLELALSREPEDLRARYLIALAAQLHSDETTIEQMARDAKGVDARHTYALACNAVRFMDYGNYARAEQLFEQALQRIPNAVDLWFGMGLLHDYAGDYEKALGAYLHVVTLDPDNASGRIGLGNAYADVGDYEKALIEYQQAKRINPETENAHQRLGRDLLYSGDSEAAAIEFRQAIAEEPDCLGAWFFILTIQRQAGKIDEALDTYQVIRERFAGRAAETAGYFEQGGAWDDAIRDYRRALEQDPADATARTRLAYCLKTAGQWEAAAAELKTVIKEDPHSAASHTELGLALLRLGRCEEALDESRKAIELDRYQFSAYDTIADCLVLQGRTTLAEETEARQERLQQRAEHEYRRKYYGD